MFEQTFPIDPKSVVSDIVTGDYRTAEVFKRFGIGYCCGGKWPLDIACEMQGVDIAMLMAELKNASRTIPVSNQLDFAGWDTVFLINYIINIHHRYLEKNLPLVIKLVNEFATEHRKRFNWVDLLEQKLQLFAAQMLLCVKKEEEVLFQYIRHLANAHQSKEPYAKLLVRTLRKPVEDAMSNDFNKINNLVKSIREITGNYTPAPNACTSHKVVMSKLKELDNDTVHHLHLEQSILYPRAIGIEKELLEM
jgi:regulator of cell morphogenesis and NO signaling